jgi:hypothetical protein
MVLKRFTYENGLDIIAPLKCGTRWLEEKTNPIKIEELYTTNKIQNITKDTYWVYREGREHLVTALRTEIRTALEFGVDDVDSIMNFFLNGTAGHWSPMLFRYMYSYWNRIEFNVIELNDLSNLFVGVEYDSKNYDMNHYTKTKHTKEDIIQLVGSTKMNKLYEQSDIDWVWLTKILNKEHNLI